MADDGVGAALDLVSEEIAAVEAQLEAENQVAFKQKRFDDANALVESGRRLLDFRTKLDELQGAWRSGIDAKTRDRVKVEGYHLAPHSKGPKTGLRVTMLDGRVIQRATAADTFADVIERLGLEKVRELGERANKLDLVGTSPSDKYGQARRGKYLIVTHSNTKTKKATLERIAKKLGHAISIDTPGA